MNLLVQVDLFNFLLSNQYFYEVLYLPFSVFQILKTVDVPNDNTPLAFTEALLKKVVVPVRAADLIAFVLNEVVPVQPSKDGIIITEYPMVDLEKLGLLKMDFLGLRNLTIIKNTLDLIRERTGEEFNINKIPLDDKAVYELLMSGETDGVFQLESAGMKKLIKELKPSVFEDLGALVALFRPGPLDSGMVDDFVKRKHGEQKITYAHPLLEPVLKDTYGTIVYQEQIMQVVQVLAGFSLGQADILRRAIGKKTAGATEALSSEEGSKAKSAADSISEDSLKQLGE